MIRALTLGFCLFVGAAPARAQPAHEALFFDDLARREFAAHHYGQAYQHFARLAQLVDTPGNVYNLGLSASLAHRPAVAFAHFSQYLAREPLDPARRADAVRRLETLRRGLALVTVRSEPPGAHIEVVGADVGSWGVTPLTIAIPPGTRSIRLTQDRHRAEERAVEAVRGQLSEVEVQLAIRIGSLRIDADSVEARVQAVGPEGEVVEGPAGESISLPVGHWNVSVTAPGRDPSVLAGVAIREGRVETRAVMLSPQPVPTGGLLVAAQGVRARVWIDGHERAETPARLGHVRAGTRRVEVRAEGFSPWSADVEITADHTRFLDVTLTRARR